MTADHPILRMLAVVLCLALGAGAAQAQFIPVTIPDDPETRKISVVVRPGLARTRDLPGQTLRDARKAMIAKEPVSEEDLRKLAEYRDGLAAARYADLLVQRDSVGLASDIAHFYGVAVGTGRAYALPGMIAAMRHLDSTTEPAARMNHLISVLYPYAWAGNSLALDAVIEFNGEGRLFGKLSETTRLRILEQAKGGNGRVELRMALDILARDTKIAKELDRARGYLERAVQSPLLAVQTTARNLLTLVDGEAERIATAK